MDILKVGEPEGPVIPEPVHKIPGLLLVKLLVVQHPKIPLAVQFEASVWLLRYRSVVHLDWIVRVLLTKLQRMLGVKL